MPTPDVGTADEASVTIRCQEDLTVGVRFADRFSFDEDSVHYAVELRAPGMAARVDEVVAWCWDSDLVPFLEQLAADYRGWDGERSWQTNDRDLAVSAVFRSGGHVGLTWTLRPGPKAARGWSASVTTWLEAGEQMASLAADVRQALPRRGTAVATGIRITWTLGTHGWADCFVEDDQGKAALTAPYVSNAPEEFLTAVARLITGATEARVQFEAERAAYRWIFYREAAELWVRLLQLRHGSDHDHRGAEIWSSQLPLDALARAVVRCFDEVARTYVQSGYRSKWGEHFPRTELETLRHS